MYNGYRLKIAGNVFPNKYISKGTYHCAHQNRVVSIWEDADLITTKVTTENKKHIITFSLIEHESGEEHSEIVELLNVEEPVEIEYYDDKTDTYETGEFYMNDIDYVDRNTAGGKIQYDKIQIQFEER